MRPSQTLPLLLSLVVLALPAGAQVKTNLGSTADASNAGQVGSSLNNGGVAPISLNAGSSPLSLSGALPSLSAPALSVGQGLAPSALIRNQPLAASSDQKPVKAVAAAASALPPNGPPNKGPAAAAPAGPPGGPPHFIQALSGLGVPSSLTARLETFLASRHPGDQDKVYHGIGHSHEVADLTARIVADQTLSPEKKILLIFSAALHDVDPARVANTPARVFATLEHLDRDDEARGLLLDYGSRYGFTAAQVKALIMATDFDMNPAAMQAKQEAFAKAAVEAFPNEPDWAVTWGKRLAFADQSATYVGSISDAIKRVQGLALEIRGKNPGPSDAVILAGSFKFLSVLKQNPLFAYLPADQRKNFDAVIAYFEARQTPDIWEKELAPAAARAPPVHPDVASAQAYIDGIFRGTGRKPTEREADSLIGDWAAENDKSAKAVAAVRRAIIPTKAGADAAVVSKLQPSLKRYAVLILRIAAEHKTSVAFVENAIITRGLAGNLGSIPDDVRETQILQAMTAVELLNVKAALPRRADPPKASELKDHPNAVFNEKGAVLAAVIDAILAKSGKSVEEVARDGAFLYADFSGSKLLHSIANRDPDGRIQEVRFYIVRKDGQWRISVTGQRAGARRSDSTYIELLQSWLTSPAEDGTPGVPVSEFH